MSRLTSSPSVESVRPASSAGVYGISVAAELAGCGVQALRQYEERGLISPARTAGGTRRYSLDDVQEVRRITTLLESGHNLAGVLRIFTLERELSAARGEVTRLRAQVRALGGTESVRKGGRGKPRGAKASPTR